MRILHLFQWNLNDINIEKVAEQNFDCIQITPLQPLKENSDLWWMTYQPVALKIGNMYGSKEDLISLCKKAKEHNIKIIADVILNHVAGANDGSIKPHEKVDKELLKYLKNPNRIYNWENRWEVIHYSIGLPGLRLDNYNLQDMVIDFLNEYIDCGVEGFRFDAAKNISLPEEDGNNFWIRVLNNLNNKESLFNYAEVIFSPKDLIDKYCKYINVLTDGFCTDKSKLVTFVESHDTYFEFKYTKNMTNEMILKEYSILINNFENTLFYSRPYDDFWENKKIRNINASFVK